MSITPRFTDLRQLPPSPGIPGKDEWRRGTANPSRRRSDRTTIAFWLSGVALGVVGCVLGACMPYRHPVAVALSVLWWGAFGGCFGASLGALACLLTERAPATPSPARTASSTTRRGRLMRSWSKFFHPRPGRRL